MEGPQGPIAGRAAQRHRLALLALLAATPEGLTRDKAVAYLWPDTGDDRARRLLSDSLYRIGKALGEDAVHTIGDELRLNSDQVSSDLAAFRTALSREEWDAAVELYAGPFLDGFHLPRAVEFSHWADVARSRLAERYAQALEAQAERRAAEGDHTGAVASWRRRAELDPYDSRVAADLMEALAAAGNPAGALRHADFHRKVLKEDLGTGPAPEVLALSERLRAEHPPGSGGQESEDPGTSSVRSLTTGPELTKPPIDQGPDTLDAELSGGSPGEIRTERSSQRSRFGYLLVVALVILGVALTWTAMSIGGGVAVEEPRLAVLPFSNLSTDQDDSYFVDGVMEEILTSLSHVPGLRVIGRASVLPFRDVSDPIPQVASTLDVSHVLQGTVRQSQNLVRIAVQLTNAEDGVIIWAESYERPVEDIFAVQSDIAIRVAEALRTRLTPGAAARMERAPTEDLEAYNAYLRGRYFWHRRTEPGLAESVRFFRLALERDPEFAQAWVGLADAHAVQAFYDYRPPREVYPRAMEAALRALELDPELPEAHASLGYITLYYAWDAPAAEAAFRRSIELNPDYSVGHQWYANLLVATGRFDEAARSMRRAREVNPLSLIANGALGWVYYHAGRWEEAVAQCDLALEMDGSWDLGHLWRGQALQALGRTEEALQSLERAVELSGGSGITTAALAHALATAGAVEEARELLQELMDARAAGVYRPPFEIAKVHVALGDHDAALLWLERAFQDRSHSMAFLEVDPQLVPLRGEVAFRRLVHQVDLSSR